MSNKYRTKISLLLVILSMFTMESCVTIGKLRDRFIHDNRNELPSVLENAHYSYEFIDLESGKSIEEKEPEKLFTPASNMKLFTLFSVLKVYPDSIPSGWIYQNRDSLVYIPSGDPSFLYKDFNQKSLTNRLKNNPNDKLYVCLPPTDKKIYGPGWAWDDDGKLFQTGRYPFALYGGLLSIRKEYGKDIDIPGHYFDDRLIYYPTENKNKQIALLKKPFDNVIEINRKINKNDSFEFHFSYFPDMELCMDLLGDTLHKEVVESYYLPEEKLRKTFYHSSTPIVKEMVFESNNFIAEQLMMMIGYESTGIFSVERGIEFSKYNLLKDFDLSNTNWVDASGLSRYNKTSPSTIVRLLKRFIQEFGIEKVKELLPAGGRDGTIANFYWGDPIYLWAKTGSMTGIYCISGVLKTNSGRNLAFSVMVNNCNGTQLQIIKEVEQLLKEVRDDN